MDNSNALRKRVNIDDILIYSSLHNNIFLFIIGSYGRQQIMAISIAFTFKKNLIQCLNRTIIGLISS